MASSKLGQVALAATLLYSAVISTVYGTDISLDDLDWVNASPEAIEAHLDGMDLSVFENGANPHTAAMRSEAERIRDNDTQMQRLKAEKKAQEMYQDHDTLIFASMSIERTGLADILAIASEDDSVAVVFRGVPDDMKVDEGIRYFQSFAAQYDPIPSVTLDPTLFDTHKVDVVPTIIQYAPLENRTTDLADVDILMNSDMQALEESLATPVQGKTWDRQVLGRVEGLSDPAWLERRIDAGEQGDFGIQGPVESIEERHLIEVMQERALAVDWVAQKEGAKERFWSKQRTHYHFLPTAKRARTRHLDPHVVVTADIMDANGNVLVPEGTTINPMDAMPFDIGLVVFDPTDDTQLEAAYLASRELEQDAAVREVMLLATRFDSDEGWDGYTSVTDYFERPVFLLPPDVKKRFELEFIPSIVTGSDSHFVVEEVVVRRADTPQEDARIEEALQRMAETGE